MTYAIPVKTLPPRSEIELLERCRQIEGMSFIQLATKLGMHTPNLPQQRKGWVGQLIELALGASAGTQAEPDFKELGIELKTLPINALGAPAESTYVTSIPLLTIHLQRWATSQCCLKLKRVLWVPIEGDKTIDYGQRRIGRAFLWSPDSQQEEILSADWQYITTQISTGYLETIDATIGEYLQVRPKAANGSSLCFAYNSEGNKVQTLPRGFYLRSRFTNSIFQQFMGAMR